MGRSSGRKRAAVLGFIGLTAPSATAGTMAVETTAGSDEQGRPWQQQRRGQQCHGAAVETFAEPSSWTTTTTTVRPSSDDDDDDIDRRASEFIGRFHRVMLLAGARRGDNDGPWPHS